MQAAPKSCAAPADIQLDDILRRQALATGAPLRPGSANQLHTKKTAKTTAQFTLDREKLETVLAELEIRTKRLKILDDYKTEEAYKDFDYLKASSRYGKYRSEERMACFEKLNEMDVVGLFNKIFSKYFPADISSRVLRDILVVIWNGTDCSSKMCQRVLDSQTHVNILRYLSDEVHIKHDETNLNSLYLTKGLLGIINNLAHLIETSPLILRECKAVEILQRFRQSNNVMVRCKTELILAYIMTEEQYEKMTANSNSIKFIITMLHDALGCPEHHSKKYGFSADEIVQGLNKIAVNDANKAKIIECGALTYYAKMMELDCSRDENYHAVHGIWTLAFKCADEIKKQEDCMQGVRRMTEHGDAMVKKHALGAIWILEGKDQQHEKLSDDIVKSAKKKKEIPASDFLSKPSASQDESENSSHVFISYQWANQITMINVRDRLQAAGYKVWMDVDEMSGSILEAMALAVEKAAVVIICMSQKYKESPNCRTEAEYTFRQQKAIVPLRLEYRYSADGWLGALVGNKLYFDFSVEERFEKSINGLIKELGNRGKIRDTGMDFVDEPSIVPVKDNSITYTVPAPIAGSRSPIAGSRSPVASWTSEKVCEWAKKIGITNSDKWFKDIDGELLLELREMNHDAPEFYFNALKQELHMSLKDVLKFTREIKQLN